MIKNYTIYFIGTIINRVASVILLPIYTTYLHPADYGALEILSMMLVLASIIFGARIGQSFFREWGLAKNNNEKRIAYGSALGTAFAFSISGALLIALFAPVLSAGQFGDNSFTYLIQIFGLNLALNVAYEIPMDCLKAQNKAFTFLFFSIGLLALQIIFNLIVLIKLDLGLSGVIHASVLASFITAVVINISLAKNIKPKYDLNKAKQMLGFSYPIIIAGICMYGVVYGDRYFLRIYSGLDTVGIYALGYKFGFVLFSLVWGPFMSVWDAEKYAIAKNPALHKYFSPIFDLISILLMTLGVGMVFWVDDFLFYASQPSYWGAYNVVPIIILAYIIFAWTDYVNFGIFYASKTKYLAHIALATAIISITLYALMIPKWGSIGAAWATVIAFSCRFSALYIISKSLFDMQLNLKRNLLILFIFGAISLIYILQRNASPDFLTSFLYSLLVTFIFIISGFSPTIKVIAYLNEKKLLHAQKY